MPLLNSLTVGSRLRMNAFVYVAILMICASGLLPICVLQASPRQDVIRYVVCEDGHTIGYRLYLVTIVRRKTGPPLCPYMSITCEVGAALLCIHASTKGG